MKYLQDLQVEYDRLFYGRDDDVRVTPFDRLGFYLDDTLESRPIAIGGGISGNYIIVKIGPSRVLSMSMYIDPLIRMQDYLCVDQCIEMNFVCTFLNNPFWFHHVMTDFANKCNNAEDPFEFNSHPFYDWADSTVRVFGNWQGGPLGRWSPCGIDILAVFGAQQGATEAEKEEGRQKLVEIVSILQSYMGWVNELDGRGIDPIEDLTRAGIKAKMISVCTDIKSVVPCDFNLFRLSVYTTMNIGCGLLTAGHHLRQLMFPVKGTAAYNHLRCPSGDRMSIERASVIGEGLTGTDVINDGDDGIPEGEHDRAMKFISNGMGRLCYCRDEVECILVRLPYRRPVACTIECDLILLCFLFFHHQCESMHSRNLHCRDWFCRQLTIYDVDKAGRTIYKNYGRNSIWRSLSTCWRPGLAFLKRLPATYNGPPPSLVVAAHNTETPPCICYQSARDDSDISQPLLDHLAGSIDQLGFVARNGSPSPNIYDNTGGDKPILPHHIYHVAHLYSDQFAKENKYRGMYVLDDRTGPQALKAAGMNDVDCYPCFVELRRIYQSRGVDVSAGTCHVGESDSHRRVTAFAGHVDKKNLGNVVFVPVVGVFWTLVAVPVVYGDCGDSMVAFNFWKRMITGSRRQQIQQFLVGFVDRAKRTMLTNGIELRVFLSEPGSSLTFPASTLYHATISLESDTPRKMLILHGFRGARL